MIAEHRIYIAGPMAGLPDMNFPLFNQVADYLRKGGWAKVYNPVDVGKKGCEHLEAPCAQDYLCADIAAVLLCDSICLLPGWENSTGASCEAAIAKTLGFDFYVAVLDANGKFITLVWTETPAEIVVRKGYPPRR